MSYASNYTFAYNDTDLATAEEYAQDYERWSNEWREREMELSDGDCAYCGDPVLIESSWNELDDGQIVHSSCRAGRCDLCLDAPGDLVRVGKFWELRCLGCEREEQRALCERCCERPGEIIDCRDPETGSYTVRRCDVCQDCEKAEVTA